MKVVALLSGGKDSCYTLLKTRLHGNEVIALAHITPPRDEADSFMYQSVGSTAVPFIAKALNLPLYTQPTQANAREQGIVYTPTKDDEVEDLVTLLLKVKEAHPDLQAVCAGALWSDYQRLRVESAASRVGLLSLAYLWHREQSELLDEMIAAGVHAILIKVAGVGLTENHLGKTLEEMRPKLRSLEETYGSHVCGEGGEYESLVLWMPGFHKRVAVHNAEIICHSENPVTPVSYLRIGSCSLEDLLEDQKVAPPAPRWRVPNPFIFRPRQLYRPPAEDNVVGDSKMGSKLSIGKSDSFFHIVACSAAAGKEGVSEAAARLQDTLKGLNETLGNVIYVTLHLRSVSGAQYVEANTGYNKVFNVPECTPPPSRACIGSFGANPPTTLEALVSRGRDKFDENSFTLHVQSLSEWAPPCIGPYAQFVEEDGVIHVCGVLPLHAPTASILPGMPVVKQVEACIYNLRKTLEASRANLVDLGFIVVYVVDPESVNEIETQLELFLNHERHVSVLLPVSGLPKDGLLEIRAVGVTNNEDLLEPEMSNEAEFALSETGMEYKAISCSKLSYMVVTYTRIPNAEERDDGELISRAVLKHPFGESAVLLSLQVHTMRHAYGLSQQLESSFEDTAISVFSVRWLPRKASFVCTMTFATEVEGSSDGVP